MATTMGSGYCYCGEHASPIVYVEYLGRWQCTTCLFKLFSNDGFVVTKPAEDGASLRCEDCHDTIVAGQRAQCGNCIDNAHDYCHDDCSTGCWECGDDLEIALCYSCLDERDAVRFDELNECENCSKAADYKLCVECFNKEVGTADAAFITDEGVITFNDIEIDWAN